MFSCETKHPQDCEGLGSDDFWTGSPPIQTCGWTAVTWDLGRFFVRDRPGRCTRAGVSDPHALNANHISSNLCENLGAPTCFQSVPLEQRLLSGEVLPAEVQVRGADVLLGSVREPVLALPSVLSWGRWRRGSFLQTGGWGRSALPNVREAECWRMVFMVGSRAP